MEIHVVQPGESLYRIAQHYGVPLAAVLRQNELRDPNRLTPGECILVPVGGRQYTVRRGDTLASIAEAQGTTVRQLWRDNPFLMGQDRVSPGQTLYLAESGAYPRKIVLGGVRQGTDARMLRRVLPQLDYLAVASFGFDRTGRIPGIHAEIPVRLARRYGVRPVFVLTMQDENGRFSGERARQVLRDPAARANLIRSAAQNAAAGEWAGIMLDFEYLMPEDRDAFSDFVRALKAQLASEKLVLLLALPPKTCRGQTGLLCEAHDFRVLGRNADLCVLKNASVALGAPSALADIGRMNEAVRYAVSEIPAKKLLCSLPAGGLQWAFPWHQGQRARPLAGAQAAEQAVQVGAPIRYDEAAQAPHYNFWRGGTEQEVWFEDARSYRAKCALAAEYRLGGVAVPEAAQWYSQLWGIL